MNGRKLYLFDHDGDFPICHSKIDIANFTNVMLISAVCSIKYQLNLHFAVEDLWNLVDS